MVFATSSDLPYVLLGAIRPSADDLALLAVIPLALIFLDAALYNKNVIRG